jgi:preprotein translocase subunit SecE
VSDERDGAGSASDGTDTDDTAAKGDDRGQTTVVTRPQRPTGKRVRREVTESDAEPETESKPSKNGDGKKKAKTAKKTGPSRNPITFVITYLKQVVAELRKVIWPNRKQMISYTTVVLVFLAFMVALIGGVDLGLAKLVALVFG